MVMQLMDSCFQAAWVPWLAPVCYSRAFANNLLWQSSLYPSLPPIFIQACILFNIMIKNHILTAIIQFNIPLKFRFIEAHYVRIKPRNKNNKQIKLSL